MSEEGTDDQAVPACLVALQWSIASMSEVGSIRVTMEGFSFTLQWSLASMSEEGVARARLAIRPRRRFNGASLQ
jgi:hypothetical protein